MMTLLYTSHWRKDGLIEEEIQRIMNIGPEGSCEVIKNSLNGRSEAGDIIDTANNDIPADVAEDLLSVSRPRLLSRT
jgi:hypothetical protein